MTSLICFRPSIGKLTTLNNQRKQALQIYCIRITHHWSWESSHSTVSGISFLSLQGRHSNWEKYNILIINWSLYNLYKTLFPYHLAWQKYLILSINMLKMYTYYINTNLQVLPYLRLLLPVLDFHKVPTTISAIYFVFIWILKFVYYL